ncbi:TPA: YPDG domain-containing protein, partial [Streptococcus suis]
MSNKNKNMFRQEQRFSFRKYSFGLASALIANVVFGATIAGGPVVHADTETEVAAVTSSSSQQSEVESLDAGTSVPTETVAAPVERQVALTYTVKVVDKAGTVLKTEVKTVDVTVGESLAFIIAELGEDLVPADYKVVDGLGQVRVVENQENVFTVTVEKEVAETSSETQATEVSETATASSEEVTEVVAASETAVAPATITVTEWAPEKQYSFSSLALLAYEVRYTDSEGEVVHKTAGLMTAESKDGVATKEVTFSASDVPAGYELAEGQSASLTKQLVENQVNILSFAVVKKSKEEEIAESQLANKDVLEQVTSEADLLADEALRQVATTQAGNTALETAAKATKEVATEAQAVLKDASATQETVDAQVETVKASTQALADEMLKVDEDGVITTQLNVSQNGTAISAANSPENIANINNYVNLVSVSITGQQITYVVEMNNAHRNGLGMAYHEFGFPKEIDESTIRIQRQYRSDPAATWTTEANHTANDYGSYPANIGNRQKFTIPNRAIRAGMRGFLDTVQLNGGTNSAEIQALHRIGDMSQDPRIGYYYKSQMGQSTHAYRYTITANIKPGTNPGDTAFIAGFVPGTTSNRWYTARTAVLPNQPTEASNPQRIYVFKDTAIATVAPNTANPDNRNKVSLGTVSDPDGIASIAVAGGGSLGYTYTTAAEATGTPTSGAGFYSRALNVTDTKGQVTTVFQNNPGNDQRYHTYILETATNTTSTRLTLNQGDTLQSREADILSKVTVQSGNGSSNVEQANNKKYRKVIVPGQTLSTAGGNQTIMVRVITASNVYKDVPVYITAPPANQAPTVTVNSTEGTQLNSDSTNNKYLFVFGTTEGTTETEAGRTNAAPVANKANATKTFATMSDPEGTNLTISYDNSGAEPRTETSLGSNLTLGTDGKIEGSFAHTAGGYYTRRVKVTDAANATTISNAFYTYAYTDKEVDTTAVTKNEGVAVTDAEIFSKLGIAVTSTGYPNTGKTLPTIPESEYTRTIVGYKQGGTYTEATRDRLPTTGEYEVKVRTRNVYGQDIYNWVTVKYNEAPDITEVGTDTNTSVYQNSTVDHYIFVFGKTEGTTEATNAAGQTAAGNAPVIDKANATKTVVSVSDPENNNPVTITYDNNAAEPRVETTLGSNLTVGTDGKLEGYFDHEAGGFHSRRIIATDSLGAKSTSNPFMTYAYTDKEVDTTPVTKTAVGQAVTNEEIFAKLGIVTSSTRFPNNTAAHDVIPTVPTNEYTREVVGYRAVGGTDVTNATTATLPTSGTYEVKVRTRNIYGQDIYNWVTVEYPNNTPATAQNPQPLYLFNNTAIATVGAGTDAADNVNKVNIATLTDPEGIQSVAIGQGDSLGYTVDNQGNAEGTPSVTALGSYKRALTVTDNQNNTSTVLENNGNNDQRFTTYIMDASSAGTITKNVGQAVTEQEILDNVTINPGNAGTVINDAADPKFRKVLAPNQTVPTTPGRHEVTVRVITDSNVYKDVPVTVVIPENPATTGTNKKPLYVFNNTPIATVGDGTNVADNVNKVNVVTLADPQGINSVAVTRETDVNTGIFNPASIGISVDTDGNASGTPNVTGLGVYSRGLTVTDGTGATTNLFPRNDELNTYVLDATAGTPIQKAVGESVTEQEILDKVTINPGNAASVINDATDPKFRKVLAPGQTIPTTPGTHTVTVRVITDSNVYKDVPVTVVIPNPPATATNKQDIYVFKNSPIQTVNPATNEADNANKVKIADLTDPQGIKQVEVKQVGSALGYTVDTEGNATGTVADVGVGAYTRELTVTDNLDAQTTVLVNGNPDQRYKTYVLDVTADTTPVAFALGDTLESRTADILSKVSISSGAEEAHIEGTTDNNPKYTKVIAPGQTLPTTPGEHTIKVRVVTESNVYKDVDVKITIPENTAPTVSQTIPNQYVWKGTAVEPAINANVQDVNSTPERDDISQVYFSSTQSTANLGNPGAVSITKDADGNYMIGGTPVGEAGYTWNRKITAVDKQNATGQSNAFSINILDSRVKAEIDKPANAEVTEAEVLEQVEVLSRTVETNQTHDITTQLANDGGVTKRVLTDLSTMPKTGRQIVQVELTTPSGHKKIEEVIVNFASSETDNATPAYAEKTVVPGTPATSTPTFTDATGQSITAPAGATYAIPASFTPPAGYTATIDPKTGVVTVTAADGTTVESIEVPVKVTYTDGSEDDTTAVFKLDTDGDGTPDITDTDDDNDNIPDVEENTDNTNPKNPDTDGDGITDGADKVPSTPNAPAVNVDNATVLAGKEITPIPVTVTSDDKQATVEVTNLPEGLTYDQATGQITGTPTGAEIPAGQDSVDVTVTAKVTDASGTPVTDTAVITIQRDTDGDGQPDVTDTDDDNDGIPDTQDANPKVANTSTVAVDDATVVAGQPITAIPVAVTTDDTQATVAVTGLPAGLTYNPTTKQIEGTPTGAEIPAGQDSVPVTVTATVTDATGTPVTDTAVITIQRDTDGDGQPDVTDTDDDNDGIPDTEETANGTDPKTPNTDSAVTPATVVDGQPVPDTTVVTPESPNTVITPSAPVNGVSVDENGKLTGTPDITDWKDDEETRTVNIPVTVTTDGVEKVVNVPVTIQRDTDGDGKPDVTDSDDDGDGIPDTQDDNPKVANTSTVAVDDATVVAGQPITAIPVTVTSDDTQATVAVTGLPAGLT